MTYKLLEPKEKIFNSMLSVWYFEWDIHVKSLKIKEVVFVKIVECFLGICVIVPAPEKKVVNKTKIKI